MEIHRDLSLLCKIVEFRFKKCRVWWSYHLVTGYFDNSACKEIMMVLDSIKPDDIIPSFVIFFFHFFGKIWFCNIRITFSVCKKLCSEVDDITIDSKWLLSEWQHLIDTNFCKSSILRQIDFGLIFINMTKIFLFTQSWSLIFELFNKGYKRYQCFQLYQNLTLFQAEHFN